MCAGSTACRWPPSSPGRRPATGGLHLRRLPQCRGLGRDTQYPGHHADGCSASRGSRLRGEAHQDRAAAPVPERRRCRGARARLRLRRGHRCPRRRGADPYAAQYQPEPEFRRRSDGGQPGLREAAARAPAAARAVSRSSTSATWPTSVPTPQARWTWSACRRRPCRLHVDGLSRSCGRAEQHLERLDARRARPCRPANWWSACSGRSEPSPASRPPCVGFLHRPAGARRRQRHVLRGHRGARRHRTSSPRVPPRPSGAGHDPRDGVVRRLSQARRRRTAVPNTTPGNKKGGLSNIVERRWARSSSRVRRRSPTCSRGREAQDQGPELRRHTASDFICGHAAAGLPA